MRPAVKRSICIIVPPFGSTQFPSLEASVLATVIKEAGDDVEVRYVNRLFAELIGEQEYAAIANIPPPRGIADYVGAGAMTADGFPDSVTHTRRHRQFAEYVEASRLPPTPLPYQAVKTLWENFVLAENDWARLERFDVVFLNCKHQQLGSCLRLARRFREVQPDCKLVVFGQYITEHAQAQALLKISGEISGVIYAGGAETLRRYYPQILAGREAPGYADRSGSPSQQAIEPSRAPNLRAVPNFDAFFEDIKGDPDETLLPMQASHGCWWADVSQCSFCGLVEEGQRYSSKSSGSVFEEIVSQVNKYECTRVIFADHLLAKEHANTLLEQLQRADFDIALFFEIKATSSKQLLRRLYSAKAYTVEIGVESFDAMSLSASNKGTSPFINIRVLKWAHEIGLNAYWTLLYCMPGETPERLQAQLSTLRLITHLQPPLHATRVRLERGSPMFRWPNEFGVTNIRPAEAALHTFPCDLGTLSELVRLFDFEYNIEHRWDAAETRLQEFLQRWQADWLPDTLYFLSGPQFVKIVDGRGEGKTITLRGWERDLFVAMDDVVTLDSIPQEIWAAGGPSAAALSQFVQTMVDHNLIFTDGHKAISVVPRVNWHRRQARRTARPTETATGAGL